MNSSSFSIQGTYTSMYAHALSWWVDDSGVFRSGVFSSNDNRDAAPFNRSKEMQNFAFKEMGMVLVSRLPGKLVLRWDIQNVEHKSLEAARLSIEQDLYCNLFQLEFNYYGWRTEYYSNANDALQRIEQVSAYRGTIALPRFSFTRQEIDTVADTHPILSLGLNYWNKRKFHFMAGDEGKAASILHQWSLETKSNEDGGLSFDAFGQKSEIAKIYPKFILDKLVSQPIDIFEVVNPEVYHVTSRVFDEVMNTERPAVDCALHNSIGPDGETYWSTATRLFLPVLKPDGRTGVSIIAVQEGSQHIPFMSH